MCNEQANNLGNNQHENSKPVCGSSDKVHKSMRLVVKYFALGQCNNTVMCGFPHCLTI